MDIATSAIIVGQVLGALIGGYSVIHGEFAYVRAIRDRQVSDAERAHLLVIGRGLKYGMTLVLLASLGHVLLAYTRHDLVQPALTATYWALMLLALAATIVSWMLARRHISFLLGSAVVFTAWWFLVYLALGLLPQLSFGAVVALFVIFSGVFYALLKYVRMFSLPTPPAA